MRQSVSVTFAVARRAGFSLVELLVVLGIIAILLGLLIPNAARARVQANFIACAANLHQIGIAMAAYASQQGGHVVPPEYLGANVEPTRRWPVHVLFPARWDNRLLLCAADYEPMNRNSYFINGWIIERSIRTHSSRRRPASEIVVLGEKRADCPEYYMNPPEDYFRFVERVRHGRALRSNLLYLDFHVENNEPRQDPLMIDPWDVPAAD